MLTSYIEARVQTIREKMATESGNAHAKYNEIMGTTLGQDAYRKATARDKTECAVRANALMDTAMCLCGNPWYNLGTLMAKKWDRNEIAFLELFCT